MNNNIHFIEVYKAFRSYFRTVLNKINTWNNKVLKKISFPINDANEKDTNQQEEFWWNDGFIFLIKLVIFLQENRELFTKRNENKYELFWSW